jgi:hypothetical protein
MITAPPGDSAIPASCADIPEVPAAIADQHRLAYSTKPRKNIAIVEIAKLRFFSMQTTGSSAAIPKIRDDSTISNKKRNKIRRQPILTLPLSKIICMLPGPG